MRVFDSFFATLQAYVFEEGSCHKIIRCRLTLFIHIKTKKRNSDKMIRTIWQIVQMALILLGQPKTVHLF
jgi:hypothetical protein